MVSSIVVIWYVSLDVTRWYAKVGGAWMLISLDRKFFDARKGAL